MLTLTVNIDGDRKGDLELALNEVRRSVKEGYLSGADSTEDDTGSYDFQITGEAEPAGESEENEDD